MKILVPPIAARLLPNKPFQEAVDGRSELAENVTRLFKASEDGLVVTVEASWGEGKTSFLRMWKAHLERDRSFIPVYYDAFAYDFTDDAFVSIAAAIYGELDERVRKRREQRLARRRMKALRRASKRLAISLGQMTASLAAASLSSGIVSGSDVRQWFSDLWTKVQKSAIERNADAKLEAFLNSDRSIGSYREAVKAALQSEEGDESKIVVFVDELDRCRPPFAVEVVEKIKHLFNIPGVFFVLGINKSQLLATVQHAYGVPVEDAAVYLDKFVDFGTQLPGLHGDRSRDDLVRFSERAAQALGLDFGPRDISAEIPDLVQLVGPRFFRLTLRGIEKVLSYISLALHSCDGVSAKRLKAFVVVAAVARVGNKRMFERLQQHGSIMNGSGPGDFFKWANDRFKESKESAAANVLKVTQLREAAMLLAMYEIPGPKDDQTSGP